MESPKCVDIGNSFLVWALAGTFAGVGQVLSGQPFDIIKVRLQNDTSSHRHYNSAVGCAKSIMKTEGLASFYKGTLSPLSGVALWVSIQFGVNSYMKSLMTTKNMKANISSPEKLSLGQYFVCGGVAGFANSFFAAPIEHIRIRMQLQGQFNSKTNFTGSYNAVKSIVRHYGLLSLYRGFVATMMRDILAFAIFFCSYETLKEKAFEQSQGNKNLPTLIAIGSLTGLLLWVPSYPIDVVKTKMQADDLKNPEFKHTSDAVRKIYRNEKLKGFFKGFTPWMFRALFVMGATVGFYELSHSAIVSALSEGASLNQN